ncbi:MAG: fructose-bisphosphate aldolase [Actinomycetota bacterium]|nr:fructose-bisphosphate aldolase [Actinomycetota bacterium]
MRFASLDISSTEENRRLDSRQSVFTWLGELEAEALEASSPKLA